jgi:hypothetical protein
MPRGGPAVTLEQAAILLDLLRVLAYIGEVLVFSVAGLLGFLMMGGVRG